MLNLRLLLVAASVVIAGCAGAPTTSKGQNSFLTVIEGKFNPPDEALVVDCVFDGFLDIAAQPAFNSHVVRQVRRATGWRVEILMESIQVAVADVKYTGDFRLSRSSLFSKSKADEPEVVAKACLAKYAATGVQAPHQLPTN